jgi:Type I phosphodiesterase / nucleotide pyrophosphatase
MAFDDLFLFLQRMVDRFVRWLRIGAAPLPTERRFLIVQIDGLARDVLVEAIAGGRMPFLRGLLERRGYRLQPMSVGMPTSTPAFQMSAMYGVRPDIPGFHYHDKRRHDDIYFPRGGDAAFVEASQARDRLGILQGGSSYGCVFTGGADNSLFSFAVIKRPTGRGLVTALSAAVVLLWVALKGLALTAVELARAVLRLLVDPVGESRRGWKFLALKLGVSIWLGQLFTLATARDLYAGVPAIYVNYLDYDVMAHAYGPRHRRALRALHRVDGALRQLWRVMRRVPGHRYDLYVLSDHGQAATTPYVALSGGPSFERQLFDEVLGPAGAYEVSPARPEGRRLARGIKAYRSHRRVGLFQRFVNYLEDDFPWLLGELKEARQRGAVRVISAGPNAFVYFLDVEEPLLLEQLDERWPDLADAVSRARGIGFVLARSAAGPVCIQQGRRYRLAEAEKGPFADRPDRPLVLAGLADLMGMRCAGDLVIYGIDAPGGHVSFVAERGAHAGTSAEELHTFVIHPPEVRLPAPLTHPTALYPHFVAYQRPVVAPEPAARLAGCAMPGPATSVR